MPSTNMPAPLNDIRAVTFEVTNRCDLRCAICRIWKETPGRTLSPAAVKKVVDSLPGPLSIALTGGEPLLHPHFDEIYRYLFGQYLKKKVTEINIATNAYSPRVLEFLSRNARYLSPLSVSVSIDGMEENHCRQRGRPHAFSMTMRHLLSLKNAGVPVGMKFVITRINYADLARVYQLSRKLGCAFYPKFYEQVTHYYHRAGRAPRLSLDKEALLRVYPVLCRLEKEERSRNKGSLTARSLRCLAEYAQAGGAMRPGACLTPETSLFITSHGKIYPCLNQEAVSTVRKWPSVDAQAWRKSRGKGKEGKCPLCLSYHGFLREFNFR